MYTNLAELFEPYAEKLDKFASDHNLEVNKWRHDMPQWMFSFRHPKGGVGRIDIQINKQKEVFLLKWWTIDDYKRLKRRLTYEPGQKIDYPLECLEDKMLAAIREIIEWDEDRLEHKGGIARGPWMDPAKRHQYPIPKL